MWGYLVRVEILKPPQVKIGPKVVDCTFIRYAHNSNAYPFLVHKLNILDVYESIIIE